MTSFLHLKDIKAKKNRKDELTAYAKIPVFSSVFATQTLSRRMIKTPLKCILTITFCHVSCLCHSPLIFNLAMAGLPYLKKEMKEIGSNIFPSHCSKRVSMRRRSLTSTSCWMWTGNSRRGSTFGTPWPIVNSPRIKWRWVVVAAVLGFLSYMMCLPIHSHFLIKSHIKKSYSGKLSRGKKVNYSENSLS